MMRALLVVSSDRLAGTERHVVELAAGLRHAGVEAAVACASGGDLERELLERGVPVHPVVPLAGGGLPRGVSRLCDIARDVDVLHAHLTVATAAAAAAGGVVGRPVVETRHFIDLAHMHRSAPRRRLGQVRRALLDRRVDLTIAPSTAVLQRRDRRPAALVPHGVAVTPLPVRSGHRGPPRFMSVGRLEDDRRHDLLLHALAAALPALPGATLTVVGGGSQAASLAALAADLGLGEHVGFTGHVTDVAAELSSADVYLAPAVEAFGMAALEAMASGLPVIGVARGGLTDLVEDGHTGLLVEPAVAELSRAMVELGGDLARARQLGQAARRRALEHFSVESMVEGTLAAYRRVVDVPERLRVLRVYHSGTVGGWRERDRELRRMGADVTLVAPRAWREGGGRVTLDAEGDDFLVPARTFGRHPNLFVYAPRPLWHTMRRQRFDIVDVHEEPCSLAATEVRLLRRLLQPRAGLLLYSAQNIPKRFPWPFRAFEAAALREAAAVYPCNEAAGTILQDKGFHGTVRVLPLGVDVDRFTPRPSGESRDAAPFRVGYIGRLEGHKGIDVLLRAVAHGLDWRLQIVGAGPDRVGLERLATELGLGGAVEFLGGLAYADMPDLYRTMDVLVVPSIPTADVVEQFGRVAVEAMASGLAVVVSRTGALPEVVGDVGVVVEPGDALALGEALNGLAADPVRRRALGEAARQHARGFSWAAVARAHLALYRTVSPPRATSSEGRPATVESGQ